MIMRPYLSIKPVRTDAVRLHSRRLQNTGGYILIYTVLMAFVLFFTFPIIWTILTSFKTQFQNNTVPPVVFFEPVLDNYRAVFAEQPITRFFLNSLLTAFGSTLLTIAVGSLAAYGISRPKMQYRSVLVFWLFLQRAIPSVVVIVPLYIILQRFTLLNTHSGLILSYSTFLLPFVILLLINFFEELPDELEDAARIDGCSMLQSFLLIQLPLAAPGIATASVFCMLFGWNEFLLAVLLTGPDTRTLPVIVTNYLYARGNTGAADWGPMTAASTLVMVPAFLFTFVMQRYLARGLTLGALK